STPRTVRGCARRWRRKGCRKCASPSTSRARRSWRRTDMDLSVVVPVYKEEKNVPEFLRRMQPILARITESYEIIFALDPGGDRTDQVIVDAHAQDPRVKLLKFSRRFGQPMATLAGMTHAQGRAVVVMDVDLQDPPELVEEMYAKYKEGFDVVYA